VNFYFYTLNIGLMTFKAFFEGIESLADALLFPLFNALRNLEPQSWWGANFMSWLFIGIFFAAFYYWMKQLSQFNASGEEDTTQTAHSYLGDS
jgi:hypothetical protein